MRLRLWAQCSCRVMHVEPGSPVRELHRSYITYEVSLRLRSCISAHLVRQSCGYEPQAMARSTILPRSLC